MKLFSFIAATAFSLDLNGVWVNRDGDLYQFDEEKLFIIGNDNSVQQTTFSTIEVNGISILMFTDRGNRRGGTIDEATETINFGAGKGLNKLSLEYLEQIVLILYKFIRRSDALRKPLCKTSGFSNASTRSETVIQPQLRLQKQQHFSLHLHSPTSLENGLPRMELFTPS